MKKALLFDPYLDTLGGGERYTLTFALGLISSGYTVELAWPDKNAIINAEDRFGLDLSKIKINSQAYDLFTKRTTILKKFLFTAKYGLIFHVSDGSLPFLFGRKNYVHFQVPFKTVGGNRFVNKIKTAFITKFVYNSNFTASVHEKHFPKSKTFILYPPIDTDSFRTGKKENIILSVARFDSPSHPKRQDILIEAFKKLCRSVKDYELILAGGVHGESETLEALKKEAGTLPVKFVVDPNFDKLKTLYSKSKFFWHAAGFGIDEETDPEKVEHFGMTTVEAMSAGAIPVVIAKGGQKEIITGGTGFLCKDAEEIAEHTITLIRDEGLLLKTKEASIERSQKYSLLSFFSNQKNLL